MELKENSKTIIIGIITSILATIILSILSYIYNYYSFIFIILILIVVIIILIQYKMNKKEERTVLIEYINSENPIHIMDYVQYPNKKLEWGVLNRESCRWLIDNNPICPICHEKLEETNYYLWYEWKCTNSNCNYKKYRTWNHRSILRTKAEQTIKKRK